MRATLRFPLSFSLAAALGCAGAPVAQQPPPWFTAPPESAAAVVFVGDASRAPDEATARDLAVKKALANLSVYAGARVKTEFSARTAEANGAEDQSVAWTVEVSGEDFELRGVRIKATEVLAGAGGYDGYALIEWPKGELAALALHKKKRAERALALYQSAERALAALDFATARAALAEAAPILAAGLEQVPLDDPKLSTGSALAGAVTALEEAVAKASAERSGVCAVGVRCLADGKPRPCSPKREGALRSAITSAGKKVAAASVPAEVVGAILEARPPTLDLAAKQAGCLLAIEFSSESLGADGDGFHYVRAGGRVVRFDPDTQRAVDERQVEPEKTGSVNAADALRRGEEKTEKALVGLVAGAVGGSP